MKTKLDGKLYRRVHFLPKCNQSGCESDASVYLCDPQVSRFSCQECYNKHSANDPFQVLVRSSEQSHDERVDELASLMVSPKNGEFLQAHFPYGDRAVAFFKDRKDAIVHFSGIEARFGMEVFVSDDSGGKCACEITFTFKHKPAQFNQG